MTFKIIFSPSFLRIILTETVSTMQGRVSHLHFGGQWAGAAVSLGESSDMQMGIKPTHNHH